jgi:hypothetical protein
MARYWVRDRPSAFGYLSACVSSSNVLNSEDLRPLSQLHSFLIGDVYIQRPCNGQIAVRHYASPLFSTLELNPTAVWLKETVRQRFRMREEIPSKLCVFFIIKNYTLPYRSAHCCHYQWIWYVGARTDSGTCAWELYYWNIRARVKGLTGSQVFLFLCMYVSI